MDREKKSLPQIEIGDRTISRLVLGSNPVCANSHQSSSRNRAMRDYFTAENIKKLWFRCEAQGINAFQSRGDSFIFRMLHEYRGQGGKLQWIGQSASEYRSIPDNIKQVADNGAIAIYHHGTRTDELFRAGKIDEIIPLMELIRSLGLPAGMGTHIPEVVAYCDKNKWPVDFYMMSFFDPVGHGADNFVMEDRPLAAQAIRATGKPVLAFKIMAAGRLDPDESFKYAFENIKPLDGVVVGMFPPDDPEGNLVEKNCEWTLRYGSREEAGK